MKEQIIEKLAQLITAAFGLVAALAWNDAIKALFKDIFGEQSTLVAMLFYAVIVTIVAVIMTVWIGNSSQRSLELIKAREEYKKKKSSKKTTKKSSKKTAKKTSKKKK